MLLTQWAAHLVTEAGWRVWLHTPRDSADLTAARLMATVSGATLNRLHGRTLDTHDTARVREASEALRTSQLRLWPRGTQTDAVDVIRAHLGGTGPEALLVDDVELTRWTPALLRTFADGGLLIVAVASPGTASPRNETPADQARLVDLADVALEVRTSGPGRHGPQIEDGYAELNVLRNRRGPRYDSRVAFAGFEANFRDMRS